MLSADDALISVQQREACKRLRLLNIVPHALIFDAWLLLNDRHRIHHSFCGAGALAFLKMFAQNSVSQTGNAENGSWCAGA
jgi:hypothetical protein